MQLANCDLWDAHSPHIEDDLDYTRIALPVPVPVVLRGWDCILSHKWVIRHARVFPLFYLSGSIFDFLISYLTSTSIQAHLPWQGRLKVGAQPAQEVSLPGSLHLLCRHGMWEGCGQPHHCVANLGIKALHRFFGALLDGVQLLHQSVLIGHDPKVVVELSDQLV